MTTPHAHDARPTHSMRLLETSLAKAPGIPRRPRSSRPSRAPGTIHTDAPSPPIVRIYTLGSFEVHVHTNVSGYVARAITGQASLLLKCLLSAPDYRCGREQLIDALWPERTIAQGQDSLRHVLASLRHALEPERFTYERSHRIAIDRHTVQLLYRNEEYHHAPPAIWVDAYQFEALANAALKELVYAASLSPTSETALTLGHKALALYRGAFLPADIYSDWTRPARARYLRLWAALLRRLAEAAIKRRQFEQAVLLLGQLVDALPDDEDAASRLMLVQGATGHRGEAHRTYALLSTHLAATLGMPPTREVQVLAHTIFSSESRHELLKLLN